MPSKSLGGPAASQRGCRPPPAQRERGKARSASGGDRSFQHLLELLVIRWQHPPLTARIMAAVRVEEEGPFSVGIWDSSMTFMSRALLPEC